MTSQTRPEYVKCIASTHGDKIGESLCGRRIGSPDNAGNLRASEFIFEDIDHWFYNAIQQGRLLGCEQCLDKIRHALLQGL